MTSGDGVAATEVGGGGGGVTVGKGAGVEAAGWQAAASHPLKTAISREK